MTGDVHSSTFEKVTDICANQVAPFLSRSRVFEKIIAKSVKNEKQALVIEIFRVLANCSAQLPQSSLKLVCEASLRNKKGNSFTYCLLCVVYILFNKSAEKWLKYLISLLTKVKRSAHSLYGIQKECSCVCCKKF